MCSSQPKPWRWRHHCFPAKLDVPSWEGSGEFFLPPASFRSLTSLQPDFSESPSLLLFPPELPLCGCQRKACILTGGEGDWWSSPLTAALRASDRGAIRACDKHLLVRGSHHAALYEVESQAREAPHDEQQVSLGSAFLGVGRAGEMSPLDHTWMVREGRTFLLLEAWFMNSCGEVGRDHERPAGPDLVV